MGCGSDKFTPESEARAKALIRELLQDAEAVVSGHSPVGGIDIWAEEIGEELGLELDIKTPEIHQWNPAGYGYKARNLDIAKDSDVVHVIVVDAYPPDYEGMRFDLCYHCKKDDHIKSGGCWTGKKADHAVWHILENYVEYETEREMGILPTELKAAIPVWRSRSGGIA